MSKKILVTKEYDARKLGVPVGTMIDYDDAPEHLRKRHDDVHAPLGPDTKARLKEEGETYARQAQMMRKNVAAGRLPF